MSAELTLRIMQFFSLLKHLSHQTNMQTYEYVQIGNLQQQNAMFFKVAFKVAFCMVF